MCANLFALNNNNNNNGGKNGATGQTAEATWEQICPSQWCFCLLQVVQKHRHSIIMWKLQFRGNKQSQTVTMWLSECGKVVWDRTHSADDIHSVWKNKTMSFTWTGRLRFKVGLLWGLRAKEEIKFLLMWELPWTETPVIFRSAAFSSHNPVKHFETQHRVV